MEIRRDILYCVTFNKSMKAAGITLTCDQAVLHPFFTKRQGWGGGGRIGRFLLTCTQTLFCFSFFSGFIFYHARSTDFWRENRGSVNRLVPFSLCFSRISCFSEKKRITIRSPFKITLTLSVNSSLFSLNLAILSFSSRTRGSVAYRDPISTITGLATKVTSCSMN